jgi:hypothetical protein
MVGLNIVLQVRLKTRYHPTKKLEYLVFVNIPDSSGFWETKQILDIVEIKNMDFRLPRIF